jgi:uncharacterized protein YcaQ
MRDYRYSLPRKEGLAKGEQNHWYERDERMMKSVLKRITTEGPLMAKDFVHTGKRIGEWKTKPAKRALEYLFMQGDLMAPKRVNFHKVYDLTERVLPAGTDTTRPDPETYARFLITRYLRANGLGQPSEVAYLQNHTKQLISKTMEDMVSSGELLKIHVTDNLYYAFPPALELLSNPLARSKLKLLSPFDNLVIQRKRMKALFGFDYQIECYVPEAKRQYGYFSLPILWDGKLVGRMDCRTERNEALLHIHHLSMDSSALKRDVFFLALRKELKAFLKFNNCNQIRIHRTTPSMIKPELQAVLDDISK